MVVPLPLRWCFVLIVVLPLLGIYWGIRVLGLELLEWLPLLFHLILRLLEVLPLPSPLILRGQLCHVSSDIFYCMPRSLLPVLCFEL